MFDMSSLEQKVRDWGAQAMDVAVENILTTKRGLAPIGQSGDLHNAIDTGGISNGGDVLSAEIHCDVDYASYTDEGPEAHRIEGHPFLAFEVDGETIIRRYVDWVPGPGVAANKGWWSNSLAEQWTSALQDAADQTSVE